MLVVVPDRKRGLQEANTIVSWKQYDYTAINSWGDVCESIWTPSQGRWGKCLFENTKKSPLSLSPETFLVLFVFGHNVVFAEPEKAWRRV